MATTDTKPPQEELYTTLVREVRELQTRGKMPSRRCPAASASEGAPSKHAPKAKSAANARRKPKRSARQHSIGGSIAVVVGILMVLGVGALTYHYIAAQIHSQKAFRTLEQTEADLDILNTDLKNARRHHELKEYPRALTKYTALRRDAEDILSQLERHTTALSAGPDREHAESISRRTREIAQEVRTALASPKIKFGGHGQVPYGGKWVTPQEKDRLFENRMKAEGKILWDEKWRTPAEIAAIRGDVYHNGEFIPKEEYNKLMAEKNGPPNNANTTITKVKPPIVPLPTPKKQVFRPESPRWVLDDFEQGYRWRSATWKNVNPCGLGTVSGSESKRLQITLNGGDQDKSGITLQLRLNLRSRSHLLMDIENKCSVGVPIAIAIQTGSTDKYYESHMTNVQPGLHRGQVFDLQSATFKSAATNWTHRAKISRLQDTMWIHILIYHDQPGKIILDNITVISGK